MLLLDSGLTVTNTNFSLVLSHKHPPRVIIAVPHDGFIKNDFGGMCQPRRIGIHGRDAHVWPVANDILHQSLTCGVSISAVRFLFPRVFIDANREAPKEPNLDPDTKGQTAYDDTRLAAIYNHYHGELCRLVEQGIQAHGADKLLFLDIHGFGKQPKIAPPGGYDLILGTANRSTIHYGEADREFTEFMEQRNYYKIFLPQEKPVVPTGDPYSAGHTTLWYAKNYGINAIQIEIFSSFRRREEEVRGKKLAHDIAEFLVLHYS